MLRLLGLGFRAGGVVVGVEATRVALRQGRLHCVVLARDASRRAREKVEPLASARGVPVVNGPGAAALGARLGRTAVHAAGVRSRGIGTGLLEAASNP